MIAPLPSQVTLFTSNKVKREEYARIAPGIQVAEGDDLPEINGTPDEIILHKALASGPGRLVEDSIMIVDGETWVDIKWRIKDFREGLVPIGTPLCWQVRLGVVHNDLIFVYTAEIHGVFCEMTLKGNAFDPYFKVTETGKSLSQLEFEGVKDLCSPRRAAMQIFLKGAPSTVVPVSQVGKWTGTYQNN